MSRRWPAAWLTLLFVGLAALMTWPQVRVLGTHAVDDQDVFFNLWRLRWIAHALATSPSHLFHGNIFHPEKNTLAFSDAVLIEGVIAAPALWAGMRPVLVHNLVLLGGIVASAVGITFLARHLTGRTGAAVIAGIVFSFAPYRFDHFNHLELQWTVWTPWAILAMQRTIESGSVRHAALTGLFLALQMASSIYYGMFLSVLLAAVASAQVIVLPYRELFQRIRVLTLGAAIAVLLTAPYLLPYARAADQVGTRSRGDMTRFSARPRDYLAATPSNVLYGSQQSVSERRLSPGIIAPLLALTGLLLVRPTTRTISYVLGSILAFELSLGSFGLLYPFLYEHVAAFRALRAPARASVFVLFFAGLLAAQGAAALTASLSPRVRAAIVTALCAGLLIEYRVRPLPLVPYPNTPPPMHAFLASLPYGVVAEFPMPKPTSPPHHDPRYAYMSTFHWKPLVNGYSGFYPPSYFMRLKAMASFPDADSIAALRRDGVRYVVVHADGYLPGEYPRVLEQLTKLGLARMAEFVDGWSVATMMELR